MESDFLLPDPDDPAAAEFWAGCGRGELLVQACASCGLRRMPPRPMCARCRSIDVRWDPVSGRGTIWSFAIPHPPLLPAYQELAPYNANLEYRAAGVNAPASVHEREAEMFYVVEGSGTLVTGGTLRDEKRTNAENLSGSAIDGGATRRLVKGDWVMVPEKTAHWFTQIEGTLVLMSVHLPHAEGTTSSR